jgi:hypothetical protein
MEECFMTGLLGRNSSFRLFTQGHVGAREIAHLIKQLAIIADFLREDEDVADRANRYWGA